MLKLSNHVRLQQGNAICDRAPDYFLFPLRVPVQPSIVIPRMVVYNKPMPLIAFVNCIRAQLRTDSDKLMTPSLTSGHSTGALLH